MIRLIEELSLNAWPALQSLLVDGWVLRFAKGYTRRANSVNPLYPIQGHVEDNIQICEKLYRERSLNVIFKMTPASTPSGLDSLLADRGYHFDAETSVQLCVLQKWDLKSDQRVILETKVATRWLEGYYRISGVEVKHRPTIERMLPGIVPDTCYASIEVENRIIACGMAVCEDGYVGLYDIVTDADFRRQGYGACLLSNLMSWGQSEGAHTAYLQVMVNNDPALHLYSKLGFQENYRYWYRVKA